MATIVIIGAGNSGLAMAAHLALEGYDVQLWNRSEETIAELKETKTIRSIGVIRGKATLKVVTSSMQEVLKGAKTIFVTTPASSHRFIAKQMAKHAKKSMRVILNPGRTFGAFEFKKVLEDNGCTSLPLIAETQTIIYTCRKTSPTSVNTMAMKNDVLLSTFDSSKNKELVDSLPPCIAKNLIPAHSMIETSIGNVGMLVHCAPMVLNVGWVEKDRTNFKYYKHGISPSVAHFIKRMDDERLAVADLLGVRIESLQNWLKRSYGVEGKSIYECIQNNDAYDKIYAPHSLDHRYIFEDIPCGLVPLESVGKMLGLRMQHTSLIIDLASKLTNTNFRRKGRNAPKLGLTIEKLRNIIKT